MANRRSAIAGRAAGRFRAGTDVWPEEPLARDHPARRLEIVHEMVRLMYDDAAYIAMWYAGDLQGYRTDKFEGFVRQPAEVGPVLFSNSSPSYALLQPVGFEAEAEDDRE